MLLIRKIIFALCVCAGVFVLVSMTNAEKPVSSGLNMNENVRDTPPPVQHPIQDSRGDAVSSNNGSNPYYLPNPSNVNDSVVYNPINRTYTIYE
jgi:hypothetical protein